MAQRRCTGGNTSKRDALTGHGRGVDREQHITVVSTVPSIATLWPLGTFDLLRLVILGGEACSETLAESIAGRTEVWNTYGPTEATVVTTAARLRGGRPTIGTPLAGWKVAVVDVDGNRVPEGHDGELVIGGVGFGRYLDPAMDMERFAPVAALGCERAYHTGDRVRLGPDGLDFIGRVDDQVKINGRRVDSVRSMPPWPQCRASWQLRRQSERPSPATASSSAISSATSIWMQRGRHWPSGCPAGSSPSSPSLMRFRGGPRARSIVRPFRGRWPSKRGDSTSSVSWHLANESGS